MRAVVWMALLTNIVPICICRMRPFLGDLRDFYFRWYIGITGVPIVDSTQNRLLWYCKGGFFLACSGPQIIFTFFCTIKILFLPLIRAGRNGTQFIDN